LIHFFFRFFPLELWVLGVFPYLRFGICVAFVLEITIFSTSMLLRQFSFSCSPLQFLACMWWSPHMVFLSFVVLALALVKMWPCPDSDVKLVVCVRCFSPRCRFRFVSVSQTSLRTLLWAAAVAACDLVGRAPPTNHFFVSICPATWISPLAGGSLLREMISGLSGLGSLMILCFFFFFLLILLELSLCYCRALLLLLWSTVQRSYHLSFLPPPPFGLGPVDLFAWRFCYCAAQILRFCFLCFHAAWALT